MDIWNNTAIAGIGATEFSANSGRSELSLAAEACKAAVDDAGLDLQQVDGITRFSIDGTLEYQVAQTLGLNNLRFQAATSAAGSLGSAGTVLLSAMAVATGVCNYVLAFRALNERSGQRFGQSSSTARIPSGPPDFAYMFPFGLISPGQWVAVRARRHMAQYGTESRHFGAIAVAFRKHANRNPLAFFHNRPMTLEDHQSSRMVADPLRLFDYCLESDGACALLITTAERARELRQRPAYIMSGSWGAAPAMSGLMGRREYPIDEEPAARNMADQLFERAGVTPKDIKVAQIYDHFTALVLTSIESLGFCKVGEGGPFVEGGRLEWPHGDPVVNTAGGHLSEGYIHGMNHMNEAVRQIRGTSTSQVEGADLGLVMSAMPPSPQGVNAGLILRR